MRSQVEISFYRQGAPIGRSQVVNQMNEHPDITDFFSWDDLVNAIKAAIRYFVGDRDGAESDAKKEAEDLLKRLLSGNDHNVFRNSELSLRQGGAVQGSDQVVDEARLWFRAWSEDDLKKTSFGKVDDPSGQIRDLGERYFRKGDDKWYEHGFSLPLRTLPVGKYVFTFASRDEGEIYDVGVVSTLPVTIDFPSDTRISLWRVDAQGNQVNYKEHGPFPDWTPLNCADNRILWRHADGHIVLWVVDEQGNQLSYKEHGPFPGWTALNYADGRILWRGQDNRISLWRVDAQGNQVNYKEHGPFPDWTPLNCADNRILWRHADGHIVLWVVDEQGNQLSYKEHGPFPGWTALNYADGRILWRGQDNRISLWRVDAQGNQVNYKEHGPFPDWTPLNCADNRILWRHADGHIVLWVVDEQGNQLSYKEHGPFPGWTALNYADGRILWRG